MFVQVTMELLRGMGTMLQIFLLTLVFSLPLGLILALGTMSKFKPLSRLIQVLVWIIRGTPLMLQLIIIFYGPGIHHQLCLLFFCNLPWWNRGDSGRTAGSWTGAGDDQKPDLF